VRHFVGALLQDRASWSPLRFIKGRSGISVLCAMTVELLRPENSLKTEFSWENSPKTEFSWEHSREIFLVCLWLQKTLYSRVSLCFEKILEGKLSTAFLSALLQAVLLLEITAHFVHCMELFWKSRKSAYSKWAICYDHISDCVMLQILRLVLLF